MLSAFTARPIVELKQRDKSKIESLLAYGDRILVGLNTGSLRIYRVNESSPTNDGGRPSSQSKAADLLREQEKFSKHRIEQLAIIKESNLLISLSNGFVSFHDRNTYELQETLAKTKGATAFAVTTDVVKDSSGVPSIVSRLAVAVKRRLLLWSWHDSELSTETPELTLVTGIKTLTWATGTRLIAGLNSTYVLVDVETSTITDIVGPGSIGGAPEQDVGRFGAIGVTGMGYIGMGGAVSKPLSTRLSEGQVLLAKDVNTHFIDTDGNALGRRQIPWLLAPEAIGYSYPFLLSLQGTKGILEVRNPETFSSLQTISLPNANQLHFPSPGVSLPHAGKDFHVSSDRSIWRMDALGYDDQIDALIEKNKFDEAISLLGMLEDALLRDKEGRLREARILKAQELFDLRKYRDALDLFTEVSAPPERVIKLYPTVISGDLEKILSDTETQHKLDDKLEVRKSLDLTKTKSKDDVASAKSKTGHHSKTPSVSPQKEDVGNIGSDSNSQRRNSIASSVHRRELEGKDLQNAVIELQGFLVGSRTKLQRFINFDGTLKDDSETINANIEHSVRLEELLLSQSSDVELSREERLLATANLVDTTLFRAYMLTRPSMVAPFFRLPNFCEVAVVRGKLLEAKRHNELINFLFGKGLHREALTLLVRFGKGESKEGVSEQLQGPQRTITYLQNLPPSMIDLILEFSEWPLKTDPGLGMEIFVADTENAETLPRDKALAFLQKLDPTLAVKYLEHIINELNDGTPEFHQRLIEFYLKSVKSSAGKSDQEKADMKEKLLYFLRTSKHYESWKVLRTLSKDDPDLHEARAIVLGNMGEHRQALSIYVFNIGDAQKAEDYCNQMYTSESTTQATTIQARKGSMVTEEGPQSVYHVLLSLYLSPPSPHEPQWGPALEILAKHGSRLPASSTLGLIPEVLPVQKLESYFTSGIRSANTVVNESRIVAGMRKTLDINEEAKLRLGEGLPGKHSSRNRSVLITEERVCGVCHKRFGGSAIKVLPNNSVVHYGCSGR